MKNMPFKRHDAVRQPEYEEKVSLGQVMNDHDSDDDWDYEEEKEEFDPNAALKKKKAKIVEAPLVNWMPG